MERAVLVARLRNRRGTAARAKQGAVIERARSRMVLQSKAKDYPPEDPLVLLLLLNGLRD